MTLRIPVLTACMVLACGDGSGPDDGAGTTGESSGAAPTSNGSGASTTAAGDDAVDATDAPASTGSATSDDGDGAETFATDSGSPPFCPVVPGTLDCAGTCDLFVWECESCPMEPGELCTYYPHRLDACVTGCATLIDPSDFVYETFACRQFVGMVCDEDAVVNCLLEIDC